MKRHLVVQDITAHGGLKHAAAAAAGFSPSSASALMVVALKWATAVSCSIWMVGGLIQFGKSSRKRPSAMPNLTAGHGRLLGLGAGCISAASDGGPVPSCTITQFLVSFQMSIRCSQPVVSGRDCTIIPSSMCWSWMVHGTWLWASWYLLCQPDLASSCQCDAGYSARFGSFGLIDLSCLDPEVHLVCQGWRLRRHRLHFRFLSQDNVLR